MAGDQLCEKGSKDVGEQQAKYGSSVCPGSQEGKLQPGVRQTQRKWLVRRGDYPAVFSVGAASP